ncbi:hypothetical protein [Aquimarina sp. 2201CG5-10]|uniref:hypothetical protein n=1 Tax=Aquimarina callyspongiae TaxID=3098150 RepID=UPI002AB4A550|nr:hypothetical protein [Aquimarina sp. 2201CG5-10]MDY8134903.1 hypothetical protein [Aquimarina sp. 2201CG5-10]
MTNWIKRVFTYDPEVLNYDISKVLALLWFFAFVGIFWLFWPAYAKVIEGNWVSALKIIGVGGFLAGAATISGSLIGFLFGVPKTNTQFIKKKTSETTNQYVPNTNLERISDWLTKIIVGVGLVEFPKIKAFFIDLGNACGPIFELDVMGNVIAISFVIHYLFIGFFQGFLLAYLWLPGAFIRTNRRNKKLSTNLSKKA